MSTLVPVFPLVLKPTGEPFDSITLAQDFFWLPPDTPWGNMQLKLMKIGQRLSHANLRLSECYGHWEVFRKAMLPGTVDHCTLHWLTAEEAVSLLRRASDELVALVWVLTKRLDDGAYPNKLIVDSVSSSLTLGWPIFETHRWLLETLNSVSNAHKHSFLQSDLNVVGALEPCVASLSVTRNKLGSSPTFQNVSLHQLVGAYNGFLKDAWERLRDLSEDLSLADGGNQHGVHQGGRPES